MQLIFGLFFIVAAGLVVAVPDGSQLYGAHCAACHGDKGAGGVGVPLSLESFLISVDDRFLRETIRHGRPGRVMPAFQTLSDAQLNAIVNHIRSWSAKPAPEFSDTPVKGNVRHGRTLFAAHCAACHGDHGEGGTGTGVTFSRQRDLPIIAPALNNAGFLAAASDALIRHTLQVGRENTPMRSFLAQGLTGQDLDDLVSYIRTIDGKPAAAGDSGAVTESIISAESPYTLEETVENLKASIVGQNFLLIRTDYLEHGLVPEGEENRHQVILHFCNFSFLYDALAVDPRVGMFLPCKITVIEKHGRITVSAINPTYLSRLFNNDELDEYCEKMHDLYTAIIEDATL